MRRIRGAGAGAALVAVVTLLVLPFRDDVTIGDPGPRAGGAVRRRRAGRRPYRRARRGRARRGRLQPRLHRSVRHVQGRLGRRRDRVRGPRAGRPDGRHARRAGERATARRDAANGRGRTAVAGQRGDAGGAGPTRCREAGARGCRRATLRAPAVGVARPADSAGRDPRRRLGPSRRRSPTTTPLARICSSWSSTRPSGSIGSSHNLLSMSRIEAGSLQPDRQAVPIDELLRRAGARLGRLLRSAEVSVDAPAGSAARERRLHDGRAGRDEPARERDTPRADRARGSWSRPSRAVNSSRCR